MRVIAQLGHAVFRKLGDGLRRPLPSRRSASSTASPSAAASRSRCTATYRTVMDSAPALGLPEVMLGLVPGWGGAFLVPNPLAPRRRSRVILENPLNNGRRSAAGPRTTSVWPTRSSAVRTTSSNRCSGPPRCSPARSSSNGPRSTAATRGRAVARGRHGRRRQDRRGLPAAATAVALIEAARDLDRDAGFAREDDALEAMSRTPELLSSLYAFDLVQKRAKRPAGAPDRSLARPVTKVGIVGAGLMASQLALLFVRRLEVPVVITDLDEERVDKGVGYVHAEVDKLLAKGRVNAGQGQPAQGPGHRPPSTRPTLRATPTS